MFVDDLETYRSDILSDAVLIYMPIEPHQLGELLDRYWPTLLAWVGGERHTAEDIIQQAFIQLAQEDPVPTNCVAWLFKVSKRLSVNQHVSLSRRQTRERVVAEVRSSDQSKSSTAEIDLHDSLAQLDHSQREIIVAKIWGGLTFEEIGNLLQLPTTTVWRSYQEGIDRLKHILGET